MSGSVRTAALLIALARGSAAPMQQAITTLGELLLQVGNRAAEINDEHLNELMLRLCIYSIANPELPEYDSALTVRLIGWRNRPPANKKEEAERLKKTALVRRYLHCATSVAGSVKSPAKAAGFRNAALARIKAKKARQLPAASQ